MSNTDNRTRTLTWYETEYDATFIENNKWQFQIAKLVATGSAAPSTNVIWHSLGIAPGTEISWDVDYALSWTATIPDDGVRVSIRGTWQPCAKGEVYDIDTRGFWTSSSESPVPGWLKVGKVNYKYPTVQGIHILVGVKNADSGKYNVIFADTTMLSPGSTGQYQPQEKIYYWLGGGNSTGAVFSKTQGTVGKLDCTEAAKSTNKYAWWTTYSSTDGKWANSEIEPSSFLTAPPPSAPIEEFTPSETLIPYPITETFVLSVAVVAANQFGLLKYLKDQLSASFTKVDVVFTTDAGKELRFSYGPPKSAVEHSLESIGRLAGSLDTDPCVKALNSAKNHGGLLPPDESWSPKPSSSLERVTNEPVDGSVEDSQQITRKQPAPLPSSMASAITNGDHVNGLNGSH